MRLHSDLVEGKFVARLNRFAALVEVAGREVTAHVANSGRMRELFQPGTIVLLTPKPGVPGRKTPYDLTLVDLGGTLVSADARLPNALVHEKVVNGELQEFQGYGNVQREVTLGNSRLDMLLLANDTRCYIEVKSVTLVENWVGLFPDAPTTRGQRHVRELGEAVRNGWRSAVVFVVQRGDVTSFATNGKAEPAFGEALREATQVGVEVYVYRCRVTPDEVTLSDRLPVLLDYLPEAAL